MDTLVALDQFLPPELTDIILEKIGPINFSNLLIRSGIDAEQFCDDLQKGNALVHGMVLLKCLTNEQFQVNDTLTIFCLDEATICAIKETLRLAGFENNTSANPNSCSILMYEYESGKIFPDHQHVSVGHGLIVKYIKCSNEELPIDLIFNGNLIDHMKIYFDGKQFHIPSNIHIHTKEIYPHHVKFNLEIQQYYHKNFRDVIRSYHLIF